MRNGYFRTMAALVEVEVVLKRKAQGYECQVCKWAWVPRIKAKAPRRCPNPDCRSRRWDATKYTYVKPPDPPMPPPPVSPSPDDGDAQGGVTRRSTCYQTLPPFSRKPSTPVRNSEIR